MCSADVRKAKWVLALVASLLLAVPAAAADKDDKGDKQQVRALQQRLRAAEAEKAKLAQERAALAQRRQPGWGPDSH